MQSSRLWSNNDEYLPAALREVHILPQGFLGILFANTLPYNTILILLLIALFALAYMYHAYYILFINKMNYLLYLEIDHFTSHT